jgi:hypothetical protein
MSFQDTLGALLVAEGVLQPMDLGPKKPGARSPRLTTDGVGRIEQRLREQRASNARVLVLALAMYAVVFAIAAVVILRSGGDATRLAAILGSGVSLVGVAMKVSSLWRDKVLIEAVLSLIAELSPEDGARVLLTLYFEEKNKRGPRTAALPDLGARG